MPHPTPAVRVRDAAIPAIINTLINGGIAYNGFRAQEAVAISVDSISTAEVTVLSQAVTVSLSLAVILTVITAVLFKRHAGLSPSGTTVAATAVSNALFMFGSVVAAAVVWQRVAGVVLVSPLAAAALVGAFAALATVVVEVRTKKALLSA